MPTIGSDLEPAARLSAATTFEPASPNHVASTIQTDPFGTGFPSAPITTPRIESGGSPRRITIGFAPASPFASTDPGWKPGFTARSVAAGRPAVGSLKRPASSVLTTVLPFETSAPATGRSPGSITTPVHASGDDAGRRSTIDNAQAEAAGAGSERLSKPGRTASS